MRRSFLLAALLAAPACGGGDDPAAPVAPPSPHPPAVLDPLGAAPTTLDQTLVLAVTPREAVATESPQDPDTLQRFLDEGLGEVTVGAGEPLVPRTLDGGAAPSAGASPRRLARFVHLADIQLADDESPARFAALDTPAISSGYRPQEGHQCRVLHAAVRTINRLSEDDPVDFVILGGDNADNAQRNEHAWVRQILGGADVVHCDSGADDDPTPGPANDPKDPFLAEGLEMPWLWVMGNHDVSRQGIAPIDNDLTEPVRTFSAGGTRDWSLPGGPVFKGDVIPDPAREYLDVPAILEALMDDGDGHGIDAGALELGHAAYTHDLPDSDLRIVVFDTASALGGSEGVLTRRQLDDFLVPALDAARDEGKRVMLFSHHASFSLTSDGGVGGTEQDAVLPTQFTSLLASYDHVVMHFAGHSHVHRVIAHAPAGGTPYWEVLTAALADYPHQMRLVEVWDQDNGFYSVKLVGLDYATEGDDVAAEGRRRGIVDMTSGWTSDKSGTVEDRNVELWVPAP